VAAIHGMNLFPPRRTKEESRCGTGIFIFVDNAVPGNAGLTMSQQKPNGMLSLGRWSAKA
jgi:hypothetical protein